MFLEDFLPYIGFLWSLSSSFVVCGDFNIHVYSVSPLVSEFMSVVDACCLTKHIDFPTHLHGHILNLLLALTEFLPISEVHGSYFISDHKHISSLVYFPSVANHQDKVVTLHQYHKIYIIHLASSALVAYPSDDIDTLCE